MRSSFSLICLLAFALMVVGCGGGGGGGGGGTTPATTVEVSGSVAVPATTSATVSSIRTAVNFTDLTAQAFDASGNKLSEGVVVTQVPGSTEKATFKLTVTPNSDVRIKVSNPRGLEFYYRVGTLANTTTLPNDVDVKSTARFWAYKLMGAETDAAAAPLLKKLLELLETPTGVSSTNTISAALEKTDEAVGFKAVKDTLTGVANAIAAKNVDLAGGYFSDSFGASAVETFKDLSKNEFIRILKYRFTDRPDKFTEMTYAFNITKIDFTSNNSVAEATVAGTLNGKTTNASSGSTGTVGPVNLNGRIFFTKEGTTWKVFQDFPYHSSQTVWNSSNNTLPQ
jgi:hypothetical protein